MDAFGGFRSDLST